MPASPAALAGHGQVRHAFGLAGRPNSNRVAWGEAWPVGASGCAIHHHHPDTHTTHTHTHTHTHTYMNNTNQQNDWHWVQLPCVRACVRARARARECVRVRVRVCARVCRVRGSHRGQLARGPDPRRLVVGGRHDLVAARAEGGGTDAEGVAREHQGRGTSAAVCGGGGCRHSWPAAPAST